VNRTEEEYRYHSFFLIIIHVRAQVGYCRKKSQSTGDPAIIFPPISSHLFFVW
jgi:hypothetical protein